jgi:asparaginyl-tRNA synthetase
MLEAEWAFIRSVDEVCDVVEGAVKNVLDSDIPDMDVLWKNGDEAKRRALEDAARTTHRWPRMTYTDAMAELVKRRETFQFEPAWGRSLQSEHERWLASELIKGPVFITDYPALLKPFYMRMNSNYDNPHQQTVACFDLLVPHLGELAGGSLREERVEMLDRAMAVRGLGPAEYRWYTDLRRFGGAPHGGFGLGFERFVGWIGGIENVRECIPVPRWSGRMLL